MRRSQSGSGQIAWMVGPAASAVRVSAVWASALWVIAVVAVGGAGGCQATAVSRSAIEDDAQAGGAGFVLAPGVVVTCEHIVRDARSIHLVLPDGGLAPSEVIFADQELDIALLRAPISLPALELAEDGEVVRGAEVMTLGFPLVAIEGPEAKAGFGFINGTRGVFADVRYFQLDVPLLPGSSGGPVVLRDGRVAGMVSYVLSKLGVLQTLGEIPENTSYALKPGLIRAVIDAQAGAAARPAVGAARRGPTPTREDLVTLTERSVVRIVAVVGPNHRAPEAPDAGGAP